MLATKRLILTAFTTLIFACLAHLCLAEGPSEDRPGGTQGNTKDVEKETGPSATEAQKPKDLRYYKIILDRDVFRRDFSRQPPRPGPTLEELKRRREMEMKATPRRDDRVLIGVFYIEGKDLALVEGGGSSEFLSVGASVRGNGKIAKIEPMQVTVKYGDETLKIRIGETLAGGKPSYRPSYSSTAATSPSTTVSAPPAGASTTRSPSAAKPGPTTAAAPAPPSAASTPAASLPTSRPPGMSLRDWMLLRRKQQLQKK